MTRRTTPVKHDGICCDNCGMDPILGHRYKCINCEDYDLCHSCEELEVHDHKHTFLKLRTERLTRSDFPFIPAPVPAGSGIGGDIVPPPPPPTLPSSSLFPPKWGLPEPRQERRYTAPPASFIDTVNQFGFRLQHLITTGNSSSGIAASNIYRSLMMAASGSQGKSREAFGQVLNFDPNALYDTVKDVVNLDDYCKPDSANSSIELAIASSVWYGRELIIEREWASTMDKIFDAIPGPQDYHAINRWASQNTRGKINNVVSPQDISPSDIKLMTALYFKAKWSEPFEKYLTHPAAFYGFDNRRQNCNMMHRTDDLLYWEDSIAQICVLPYQNNKPSTSIPIPSTPTATSPTWKAAIILPKNLGLPHLQAILSHFSHSPSTLRTLLTPTSATAPITGTPPGLKSTLVHLSLPRFTLRLSQDLSETLFDQGLRPASKPSHDFSQITRTAPVAIAGVKHDLFVEVNEEGTEIAAVSTTAVFGAMPRAKIPVEMKVERPFLFLVFDEKSGLVVCVSVVGEV
ncbi:hypothetical protein FQN55_000177 [Onygenales sp. PD_40]|nr:hypothetical protein FQN55_000177 [Onygenales sp. PD_40]KAK2780968.1 hypothetical protein FQN52_001965 [Onygenales sp. PD_12]KAK2790810.1 hypothetical protein FQN53_008633 [Emmonsiellopsis sp. PD_33]